MSGLASLRRADGWRSVYSTCGVWYAAHTYQRGDTAEYAVLLCLGAGGPVIGFGEVRRLVGVLTHDQAEDQAEAFTRACARWRRW